MHQFLGDHLALNPDAMRTPGIPTSDPVRSLHYQMDKNPALNIDLEHLVKTLGEQA